MSIVSTINDIEKLKAHGGNVAQLARKLGVQPDSVVDFSSNINPYGPTGSVIEAVRAALDAIGEYPEQEAESFVRLAAEMHEIGTENIVAGNGTIELIYMLARIFGTKKALLLVPSFTEYELALLKSGIDIIHHEAFSSKEASMLLRAYSGDAGIVIMGNPNNPCGYSIEKGDLVEAIDRNPDCMWVIDEAFIDFVQGGRDASLVKESVERKNLVVLRSLTKIHSIPGLRLGYMTSSSGVAARVRDEKYPWSINSIAIAAGVAAVKEREFVDKSSARLAKEAQRVYGKICRIKGVEAFEPAANYILVKIEGEMSSTQLQKELLKKGFAVRDCSSYTGMDNSHFRVAVKRPEDNDRLLEALRAIFSVM